MSLYYYIYGLHINSSRRITILDEIPVSVADLCVVWTTAAHSTPEPQLNWEQIVSNNLEYRKRISFFRANSSEGTFFKLCFITDLGILSAILDPGKQQLWMLHSQEEPESNLDSYFIGTVLGCVLRLKGVFCLHASVVNIDGQAIIFLGRKKSGKSTTAAAFVKLGFKILSDDIAVISLKNNQFYIEAGYPKVRLRPKSLAVLHPEIAGNFVSVYSHRDSRYSDIKANFWDTPLPLGAIYVMGETVEVDGIPSVESITAERIIHLHSNTFGSYVITSEERKQEFAILSRLALEVPVRLLRFGRDVQLVNLQCQAVIEDFDQIKAQTPAKFA